MAATIFVWRPHGGLVGHASMGLSDGTYISWWPGPDGENFSSGATSHGMRADRSRHGEGKTPDYASPPIDGLDEAAMSKWWQQISARKPGDYSTTRHEVQTAVGQFKLVGANCSNMVIRALLVGGVTSKYPLAGAIIGKNAIATPLMMIDVAEAITGDFTNKAIAVVKNVSPGVAFARTLFQYVVAPGKL